MGLFEIFEMIFEAIIGFIGGLFISNSVTFGTPPSVTDGADVKRVNSSNYTVNKNATVSFDLEIKGYKSYKIQVLSGTTGGYATASSCKKVSDDGQTASFSISTTNKYARNVKVIAYETDDCKETSKEYVSPSVSYKAPTVAGLTVVSKSGVDYSMVPDKSNGAWRDIGTQGHYTSTCNCYTKAYALKMVNNTTLSPNKYGTDHDGAVQCWDKKFAGNYYLSSDRSFVSSKADVFGIVRDALKYDGLPTMVQVKNSSGNPHYLLVIGIKKDSLNKGKSNLSYSDFWVVDPVGSSSSPSATEDPKERNWQTLINNASGNSGNRQLRMKDSKYEVTEMHK